MAGNVLVRVCLSVLILTFESQDLETSALVCCDVFTICNWVKVKVTGAKGHTITKRTWS